MSETTPEEFAAAHAAWHAEVEAGRTAPFGPLSAVALHWLTDEPQTFDAVPGSWSADAQGLVTATLSAAEGVTRDGRLLEGTIRLGPLTGLSGLVLDWGERRIELAARSGHVILRPRDPASPDRVDYRGTAVFPPSEHWVIAARFVPAPRAEVEIASAAGADKTQHYDSPGTAEFEIDGQPLSLTLFGSVDDGDLRAIFADASGADLTFPSTRAVSVRSVGDGTVEIDFNRTANLPCAYSASATCPFPPPENRLPVRIEAGELRPGLEPPAAAA